MSLEELQGLKRKRSRQRSIITRLVSMVEEFSDDTPLKDIKYNKTRLEEELSLLSELDDDIHNHLSDEEYNSDLILCDEYVDKAKHAIFRAQECIEKKLSASTTTSSANDTVSSLIQIPTSLKLPSIKLEPFSGDIETWPRFWEQFESCIDKNVSVSTVNKHVFLRGYLVGEPKQLVDGIAVIASTYEDTKRILQARYGDRNRIVQAHLDYLDELQPIRFECPETLNTTFIECNKRIQALKSLGEDVNAYGKVLMPKILRAFPENICRRWVIHAKREKISEGDILRLMEFLGEEIDGALTAQKIRKDTSLTSKFGTMSTLTPTAASLNVNSKQGRSKNKINHTVKPFCVFCERTDHWAQDCKTVRDISERLKILRSRNRCFLCLKQGHIVKDCTKRGRATCSNCKGSHHRSVCVDSKQTKPSHKQSDSLDVNSSVSNVVTGRSNFTHLQTARVFVMGPTGKRRLTRCILDAGSQSTFICRNLIDYLNLQVIDTRHLSVGAFECSLTSGPRRFVRFQLSSTRNNAHITLNAFESLHSFTKHPTVPNNINISQNTENLFLADPTVGEGDIPIELLIGADHYWEIVDDAMPMRISPSLVLLPSKIGWILSGCRLGTLAKHSTVNLINLAVEEPSEDTIRSLWDLETIGISMDQKRLMSEKESAIMKEFRETYALVDQRRVVRLPRKSNVVLPNNFHNAERRFAALQKRLSRDDDLRHIYDNLMFEYIKNDHVELAPTEESANSFYLPHHLVKREKQEGTKCRIVFDGSSHEQGAPSLNDTLEIGPNLLPEVTEVLLRFRIQRFVIIADIVQAFLQLSLHSDDRDLTRFFWYKTNNNKVEDDINVRQRTTYRFSRLPFGLTCSPFLLSATIRELADTYQTEFPTAATLLHQNMYMDDFAAGTECENSLVSLYYELCSLMKKIKLPLSKWASNSQQLSTIWKVEGRDIQTKVTVLGMIWNSDQDTFLVSQRQVTEKFSEVTATKRNLLRATAGLYDPLGLITPVSIVGKVLFQDTWLLGLGWDEPLPHSLSVRWRTWMSNLPELSNITVPRWIQSSPNNKSHIHVFCDASERAYGAVLYITFGDGNAKLMCSKSRLAPVKKITLPRLELLAALSGARLLHYYCKVTTSDPSRATLWSDSVVTLAWIKRDPATWKTFVCNRVTEIQTLTVPSQWRHCPGKDNPADLISRGSTPQTLRTLKIWWNGPPWLAQHTNFTNSWPSKHYESNTPNILLEARKFNKSPQTLLIQASQPIIDVSRFSSYWKLLRTTAYVLRFKRKLLQKTDTCEEFTAEEIAEARFHWIKTVQRECFSSEIIALSKGLPLPSTSKIKCFNPFLDGDLLRLGGRLQYAEVSDEERHPIILEGNHHFTKLLIMYTHIKLHHLGVLVVLLQLRESFWILHARRVIKTVLRSCLPCRIAHNMAGRQIEAPLPADRVKRHKPFEVSGIDFAGPLYSKSGTTTNKCYILLFTCAVTRALHLELTTNSTTDRFLLAFQRFIGRRGIPHTVYSDNAQTFHAANREITEIWTTISADKTRQFVAEQGITWKFIAPRAAWWGGWWERMVGSCKRCLRKVLGRCSMDEEGLQTVLVNIEAALNSRPITQTEDEVLTPAHFLVGGRLTTLPTGPEPPKTTDLVRLFNLQQKILDDFWKRWSKEYLLLLRIFHQVKNTDKQLKIRVGDIVLLQEDVLPRHMWKRARVKDLRTGRDGLSRTVVLVTPDGRDITRPVQLVVPLEVDQGGEDVEDQSRSTSLP